MGEVKIPDPSRCPFCGDPIDRESAPEMETRKLYVERIEGPYNFRWDNPFSGFWLTGPPHCIDEAGDLDKIDKLDRGNMMEGSNITYRVPHWIKRGRQPDPEVSRIARVRGISRDAARKWVKRHPKSPS